MSELIELALSAKKTLDFLISELETVCKNKKLTLSERYEALIALSQVGGGHNDWVYHGWDKVNPDIISDMWFTRNGRYDLLDVLMNHLEECHPNLGDIDEAFVAYKATLPEDAEVDYLEFLLFVQEDLTTIELVECLCDTATVSFTYDW